MDKVHRYKIITFTHRNTHLNEIGDFVIPGFSEDVLMQKRLNQIKQQMGLQELMYLATCNRVMFFFITEQNIDNSSFQRKFFQTIYPQLSSETRDKGQSVAFYYQGLDAITHLYEVASSMDSLVVGEREILRQLREAYSRNRDLGLTGDGIRIAMRFMVETAKKVYSSTRIGEKQVSVVSLAIKKLMESQPEEDAKFLLVGAGQTNRLVLKFLTKQGFHNFAIFNRRLQRAEELANSVNGQAFSLESLSSYSRGFDVIIAATGATEAIVTPKVYKELLGEDEDEKLLIDLSVPNNISPKIAENFKANYIPIESLRELADANLAFREKEVTKAKDVVAEYVETFYTAFKERQIEVALRDVPIQIKAIRHHALNNVFKSEVANLDDESKALIDRMMAYMEKRCIAIPIQVAKEKLTEGDPTS